jgi:hypothetical protein
MLIDTYIAIADLLDSAQARGEYMTTSLENMHDVLTSSEILSDDIDGQSLAHSIESAYDKIYSIHENYSFQILDVVRILQKYITETYGSVDAYLGGG